MKGYLFSFSAFFLSILLIDQSTCSQQADASTDKGGATGIYPLAEGNYWIYRDSIFSDGRFSSIVNDTDKIVSSAEWNGRKTFVFDDGREWFMSGDTIYQLASQRSGFKFPSPVMMPSEKESSFNYVFGGDVVMHRKVSKLPSCPDTKWKPSACYIVSDDCGGNFIVGYGVGVLREKIGECFSQKNTYTTRTLVDCQLKGK